jgi:outer membrane murein-binding lipoprotein Lpp
MIYPLTFVSVFVCCLINHPVKASSLDTGSRTKQIDTLLVGVHQSKIDAAASNTNTLEPTARKIPVSASHVVLNHHRVYRVKSRRQKIEAVAENVRKIQAKVDKIEARIREIELQDQ